MDTEDKEREEKMSTHFTKLVSNIQETEENLMSKTEMKEKFFGLPGYTGHTATQSSQYTAQSQQPHQCRKCK